MTEFLKTLDELLPFILIPWALLLFSMKRGPQRFRNCFLLMVALMLTAFSCCVLFGSIGAYLFFALFIICILFMLITPFLLIFNGFQMMKNEGRSLANILSLLLGIAILIGEACFIYGFLCFLLTSAARGSYLYVFLLGEIAFYCSFVLLSFIVYSIFILYIPHNNNFEYIIIHGCGLIQGEKVSKLLSNRIDKAIQIYEKSKVKPILIPSGGKGDDEKLAEAEAMKQYLIDKGIPEEDIIMENQSKTTMENLMFSKRIIDERGGSKRIALVSSNYHIYRCLVYARKINYKCTGIGAKVALYYYPSAIIREFVAVFKNAKNIIIGFIGLFLFLFPTLLMIIN